MIKLTHDHEAIFFSLTTFRDLALSFVVEP